MAPTKPMLGDIELRLVQKIDTEQDQTLTQHEVPALEGDFLQRQGRRASRLTLEGVMTGPEAGEQLSTLRDKFRAAEPVPFVADIATATKVGEVLIEELSVRELAGNPERFAYALTLREHLPAPRPTTKEPPEIIVPEPVIDKGTLVIDVVAEGAIDMANVTVTIEGTNPDATSFSRSVTNRTGDRWTESNLLPGRFTVSAATQDADPARDTGTAQVLAGQTAQVTLTLRRGAPVATTFLVHFRFDKAFVEPCARAVLRQVVDFAGDSNNSGQKLVIVGNTDKTGSGSYNQALSERRARSVFAFLTFGGDPDASIAEWDALRRTRPQGTITTVKDSWGLREAQHMLQDLGDYPGNVDGKDGPLTREAVRAFRCRKGLPPGVTINENEDDVWKALMRDYMGQDSFNLAPGQFLPNCPGEILKWLGCGEEDPVNNTEAAFRPSRRTELLFVRANSLPCQVPQPDTFNLPNTPPVNNAWCVGPTQPATTGHGCFVSPHLVPGTNNPQPCSTAATGPWCRQPAEPGSITVSGRIMFENNTPAANQPFVLIAANGEFVTGEASNGEPRLDRTTNASGEFSFPDKPKGFYYLDVRSRPNQPPLLVRLEENGDETVKGNAVCKALRADTDRLNVVIIDAPTIREIRLPAAVHLMTALHPTTREVRLCPSPDGSTPPGRQATAHTEAEVSGFIEASNRIWRQARVRLLLDGADNIREAYSFATVCEVDATERALILERCAYPNTVNFFFFGDLSGTGGAGVHNVVALPAPRLKVEGISMSDRVLFIGIVTELRTEQVEQGVAHEFGHFLSLDHVGGPGVNANRLMLPGLTDGLNRTLVQAEVDQARGSDNAGLDCLPLSLNVTGATRIGGARSHEFMTFQDTSGASVVTVDAVVNPQLLQPTAGALVVEGGLPGAGPQQRTVNKGATGQTEIVATYTPATGGNPIITYVDIFVVTFRLRVEGATQVGGASGTTFVVVDDDPPTRVVTVIAVIDPQPFCVPFNLVSWSGGTEVADPLRRTLTGFTPTPVTITATLLGTTQSVTIAIFSLKLRVEGAIQMGDRNSTIFAALTQAGQVVTVIADVPPLPPALVPPGVVTMTGGTEVPGDPLRRTVSRATASTTNVRATAGSVTKQATIQVIADPSLAGPFAVGALEYTEVAEPTFNMPAQGTFAMPTPRDSVVGTFSVRTRALIRYPAVSAGVNRPVSPAQSTYPLIVILHGRHRARNDVGAFVESYRGHEYIARHLASHGYIAISIDVDDINPFADMIFGRGAAVNQHINVMANLNTTHPTLTGRINMGQIGLIGHSRGGEGVVAAERLNQLDSLGHQIKGVVSIAPTNFESFAHSTTPYLVIYGSLDGDVSGSTDDVNPFLLYDNATAPKAMIFVYAAIHNRFSNNTDWLLASQIDSADPRQLTDTQHHNIAKGFCLAFFERHFRNQLGQDIFFTTEARPQSVAALEMHHQYRDRTLTVVDDFEQPSPSPPADRVRFNTIGLGVDGPGLATMTEARLRHIDTPSFVHNSFGVILAWDNTSATYVSTLGTLDASSFQVLSFRVTQRAGSGRNTAGAAQDFFVRLTDTGTQSAAVRVGTVTTIPAPFPRTDFSVFTKSALKTIRMRLDDFKAANANLNLSALQTMTFEFRQTARGEIAVDDIEFSI